MPNIRVRSVPSERGTTRKESSNALPEEVEGEEERGTGENIPFATVKDAGEAISSAES